MPFSHHSHSGQFCNHAKDSLEDVVKAAISQKMLVFCMTEHMPRDREEDLYPEESEAGLSPEDLHTNFAAYIQEARRLQEKYENQITILIGTETDWIIPENSQSTIRSLFSKYNFDLFIGSIHHVHTVPIDFSKDVFQKAVLVSAGKAGTSVADGESQLAADYFDLQFSMLEALKPPIVGHFDLIRLLSEFEKESRSFKNWPIVWEKVLRNLRYIRSYGGCLEINSAALRKGLKEPYPRREICKEFHEIGGRFVLSDDSHGISQVGHSYSGVIDFMESIGIEEVAVFEKTLSPGDMRFTAAPIDQKSVKGIRQTEFMRRLG